MERITYWWVMCGLPWARWALPAQDSLIQYPMLTWLHQATKSWDPSTTLVRWQSSVVEIKEKGVLRCFHSIAIGRYNVPVFVLQKGDTLSHQFWFGTLAVISWWMNVHSPFWPLSQPPLEKHPKKNVLLGGGEKRKKVSMPRDVILNAGGWCTCLPYIMFSRILQENKMGSWATNPICDRNHRKSNSLISTPSISSCPSSTS